MIRARLPASLYDLPAEGDNGTIHVVVEAPRGSTAKIKYDPALGAFVQGRLLPIGMAYPHDWGFVPGTKGPDGDPVDALVLSESVGHPGLVVPARALGVIRLSQKETGGRRARNDRIIAVPTNADRQPFRSCADLPGRLREELEAFFVNIVAFADKDARLLGFGGPDEAMALVRQGRRAKAARR